MALIRELADFEGLSHQLELTEERLRESLFGENPLARALLCEWRGATVGYALYFFSFSSFLGRPSLHLEDVYVRPEVRRCGLGMALLDRLARIAKDAGCGRMEWTVLDWNRGAVDFYGKIGARVLPDWRLCRLDAEGIARRAAGSVG